MYLSSPILIRGPRLLIEYVVNTDDLSISNIPLDKLYIIDEPDKLHLHYL